MINRHYTLLLIGPIYAVATSHDQQRYFQECVTMLPKADISPPLFTPDDFVDFLQFPSNFEHLPISYQFLFASSVCNFNGCPDKKFNADLSRHDRMKFVEDVCRGLGELAYPSLPSLSPTIMTHNVTKSASPITKIKLPPTTHNFISVSVSPSQAPTKYLRMVPSTYPASIDDDVPSLFFVPKPSGGLLKAPHSVPPTPTDMPYYKKTSIEHPSFEPDLIIVTSENSASFPPSVLSSFIKLGYQSDIPSYSPELSPSDTPSLSFDIPSSLTPSYATERPSEISTTPIDASQSFFASERTVAPTKSPVSDSPPLPFLLPNPSEVPSVYQPSFPPSIAKPTEKQLPLQANSSLENYTLAFYNETNNADSLITSFQGKKTSNENKDKHKLSSITATHKNVTLTAGLSGCFLLLVSAMAFGKRQDFIAKLKRKYVFNTRNMSDDKSFDELYSLESGCRTVEMEESPSCPPCLDSNPQPKHTCSKRCNSDNQEHAYNQLSFSRRINYQIVDQPNIFFGPKTTNIKCDVNSTSERTSFQKPYKRPTPSKILDLPHEANFRFIAQDADAAMSAAGSSISSCLNSTSYNIDVEEDLRSIDLILSTSPCASGYDKLNAECSYEFNCDVNALGSLSEILSESSCDTDDNKQNNNVKSNMREHDSLNKIEINTRACFDNRRTTVGQLDELIKKGDWAAVVEKAQTFSDYPSKSFNDQRDIMDVTQPSIDICQNKSDHGCTNNHSSKVARRAFLDRADNIVIEAQKSIRFYADSSSEIQHCCGNESSEMILEAPVFVDVQSLVKKCPIENSEASYNFAKHKEQKAHNLIKRFCGLERDTDGFYDDAYISSKLKPTSSHVHDTRKTPTTVLKIKTRPLPTEEQVLKNDNQCAKFEKSTNCNSGTDTWLSSSFSEVIDDDDYHNKSLNDGFDKFFNIDWNAVALESSNITFDNDARSSCSRSKNTEEQFQGIAAIDFEEFVDVKSYDEANDTNNSACSSDFTQQHLSQQNSYTTNSTSTVDSRIGYLENLIDSDDWEGFDFTTGATTNQPTLNSGENYSYKNYVKKVNEKNGISGEKTDKKFFMRKGSLWSFFRNRIVSCEAT